MKILKKLFKDKKENPFLTIFKQASPSDVDFNTSTIFHLKSFEKTNENMNEFEKSLENIKRLNDTLNKLDYNSQSDNVSVYYVVNSGTRNKIYLLSDPLELYEKEHVMKEYSIDLDENVMDLDTVEQIN